jgi:hypothetical protein
MGEAAAAGLFPTKAFVKDVYVVSRARELFTAHCAGRPAADDCYLRHNLSRSRP